MNRCFIYHNPNCSKSRGTLELLREKNVDVIVIEYLSDTPSPEKLGELASKLGLRPAELIRKKEAVFQQLQLNLEDDGAVLKALHDHPILIERPIVETEHKAAIGRPPESVLSLF